MRVVKPLGFVLVAVGVALGLLGVMSGEIQVGLALFVIPYLYGSSALGALAFLTTFAGLVLIIFEGITRSPRPSRENIDEMASRGVEPGHKFGGVVLIGPIPIVFGSSDRAALYALIVAAVVVMAMMLAFLLL